MKRILLFILIASLFASCKLHRPYGMDKIMPPSDQWTSLTVTNNTLTGRIQTETFSAYSGAVVITVDYTKKKVFWYDVKEEELSTFNMKSKKEMASVMKEITAVSKKLKSLDDLPAVIVPDTTAEQ